MSVEDLVSDPAFRNWVLRPDSVNNRYWENLLNSNDEKREVIDKARSIVYALEQPKTEFNNEDESVLWDRIQSSIKEKSNDNRKVIDLVAIQKAKKTQKRKIGKYWYLAVASVMLLVATYFSFDQSKLPKSDETNSIVSIEKKVLKGQKLKLYLPDGSKVALNSQSQIIYPEKFSESDRIVEIEGEAFFEVKKDSLRPFIVKSKSMITEVLGTTFNFSAYPSSENTTVSLLEGKVKVSLVEHPGESAETGRSVFLLPGEEVNLNEKSGEYEKRDIKNMDELQWMDGVLSFRNATLSEVFEKLEMWYGVDFVVTGELPRDEVVTGEFKNEYLDNILQSICYTVKFNYKIDGDSVYVNL